MAKKKRAADVNKSQEIRQALTDNPGMKPKDIAALLVAKGVPVTPAYVSIVKSSTKGGGKRKTKRVVRIMKRKVVTGLGSLAAAIEFIRAAGGVEQAKRALAAIEELRRL
jgi:deoxyribose-phosphate aldolase